MIQPSIDATAYEQGQQNTWNAQADAWAKWFDVFEDAARPVTRRPFELADVVTGHSILDIATGTGEPALSAAIAVGAQGRVVAVDQAAAMLIEFIERDVEVRGVLRERCGSEDAPEIWDAVTEAVPKFERDDESISMTSTSTCFKAVKRS